MGIGNALEEEEEHLLDHHFSAVCGSDRVCDAVLGFVKKKLGEGGWKVGN